MANRTAAAALVVLSALVLAPNLPPLGPPQEDTGTFLYVASVIRDGGFPYRDVWDHKPPLVYLVDLVGLLAAGTMGVWALEVLALFAAAWIGFRALSTPFGPRIALLACAAFVLATPRVILSHAEWTNFTEIFAIPLQFTAVALYARGRGTRRLLLIGMLGGLCFLLKPSLIGVTVAIALHLGFLHLRQRSWRELARSNALLGLGGAVPIAAVAVWLAGGGALADGIDQAIRYNLAYAGSATLMARAEAVALGLRLLLPNGLIVLALAGIIAAAAMRTRPLIVQVALIGLPIEALLATASGRPYMYYFIPWLWVLAVLAAPGLALAGHLVRRLPSLGRGVAIRALLIGLTFQPLLLVFRQLPDPGNGWTESAVEYVSAHTAPSDGVLIWGSRSAVLFLTERDSPTRYVYQYAPLYTVGYGSAARVHELLDDLQRDPPLLIVDSSPTAHATPPIDPAAIPGWPSPDPLFQPPPEMALVAAWIRDHYELADVIPVADWPVWRLRSRS